MTGKNKCKILKEIRQKIADANDIPFITAECKYQGNCKGTCPKCEEELLYLENELAKRQQAGKRIVVAGLATAATLLALNGCTPVEDAVDEIKSYQTQGMVAIESVQEADNDW